MRREIAFWKLLRVRLCCRDLFQLSDNVQKFGAARLLVQPSCSSAIIERGIEFPGCGAVFTDLFGEFLGFFDVSGVKRCAEERGIQPFIIRFPCSSALAGDECNRRRDASPILVALAITRAVET